MRPSLTRSRWRSVLPVLAAAAATAAAAALLLIAAVWLAGYSPSAALRAMASGAFGSWDAVASGTLVRATPLILTGLAVALAFRAGIWNIGAEGQLLVGAATATALGLAWGESAGSVLLAIAGGAAAGAAWAGIAALLRERAAVLEVLSTIMLNFVALHLVGYLVRGPLQEPLGIYPQSASLPAAMRLPAIVPGTRVHAGFLLAIAGALVLWWVLRATAAGFRVRLIGQNPVAARLGGQVDVSRTAAGAFLASGALAGIAGAVEVSGVTFALYENLSPGYGYTAIAVALLARLHPFWVIATGGLFGALEAGGAAMQRDAGIPAVLVSVVEALLILALLASDRLLRRRLPGVAGGWLPAGGARPPSVAAESP